MKLKLLPKLMISLAILGIVLTLSLSFFGYYNSKAYLEHMYAYRVVLGAKKNYAMIDRDDVRTSICEKREQNDGAA